MKLAIALLAMNFLTATAWCDAVTLCTQSEKVYFSCVTKPSGKLISVCGSSDLTSPEAYLQYRFGSARKVELEYPSTHDGSVESFTFYHYVRPQVTRIGLTFKSGHYSYTVHDHYEGDTEPAETFTGVSVTEIGKNKQTDISCKGKAENKLIELEDIVPCDPENALSNCNQ